MDKDFKPINEIYLNQSFCGETDQQRLAESQEIAKAHVLAENAIVSMGNNIENCSYCYFGGLADMLGIPKEERQPMITSLYEEFVFGRANEEDLAHRHAHELAFLHTIQQKPIERRKDYYLSDFLRIHDNKGKWHWVEHRMYPMAIFPNNTLWLCMCIYTMSRTQDRTPKIINARTGERRILTNEDYETLLSQRELEVLRLIHEGLLSKEIADQLHISLNTVNRHRQNILQKLKVNNAMEACKAAKLMGLLTSV